MRIVTYGAACSLDGFIAAADGAVDWLHFSRDAEKAISDYWASIDALLMGRRTWEVAAAQGGGGSGGASPIATYVFSRSMREAPAPGVVLVSSGAGDFVRELKELPGKGICLMGGGDLARSLFEAGVVDEVTLNIHPVLLGSGIRFFRDPGRRIALTLTDSRAIEGGCVHATYRVGNQHSRPER